MGLSSIISSGLAGLQAVQAEMQTRSDNISNASNTNYSERTPVTVSVGTNAVTATLQRAVDQGLQNQYLSANSQSSAATAQTNYLTQINNVLGTTQSTPYLQQSLDNFTSSWQAFETDTSDTTSESQVVSTGQTLAQTISQNSQSLIQLGVETNNSVGSMVTNLNTDLSQLDTINKELDGNPLAATDQPDLLDNRDSLINSISSVVGVNVITHSNGSVALYTQNGTALVDKTAAQFTWNNPTGGTQGWLSLAPPAPSGNSAPGMNGAFTGGTLGAALNFLNPDVSSTDPNVGALAKAQAQLNIVASQLADNVAGTFGGAYYSATPTQTTDLQGGTAAGPTPAGNQMSSFFTIDNGSPASQSPASSIQINPGLANGTNTVMAQSATAVVAALTATNRSLTTSQTGTTTNGSATITGLSQNSGLMAGMTVTGTGIPAGTTILSVSTANGTTITLSNAATAGAATALTFGLKTPTANNVSYSGLAAAISTYQSTSEADASTNQTQLTTTTQNLQTRLTGELGVNMDTELAQLTVLQNAYSANAKVISTVQSMFDTLMGIST
jgi:flagellar hook-associated protein 1 FlgK